MSLATMSHKPWVSTVFYAVDDNFNLYFSSNPTSRHAKEIMADAHVALAIADSGQKVTDDKTGVQIEGVAALITDREEMSQALDLWHKANPGMEDEINVENIESGKRKSAVFKIKPTIAKFLHDPAGQEIIEF